MRRVATICLILWVPSVALAEDDAKTVAQGILDKGAALFDTRDAMSMATTYAQDARIFGVERDKENNKYKTSVKEGRAEIGAE